MKRTILKIFIPLAVAALLAAAFFMGEEPAPAAPPAPALQEAPVQPSQPDVTPEAEVPAPPAKGPETPEPAIQEEIPAPQPEAEPALEPKPEPAEPPAEPTCTISISCAALLARPELMDSEKLGLIPGDGWILPPTEVVFYEGESAFNILQRACRQNAIHMEYEETPIYDSAYIEGIANLYEFDAGNLSGWMYSVNDWFPNYGCSRYQLQNGDTIQWVYTCDLGADVGGEDSAFNGRN